MKKEYLLLSAAGLFLLSYLLDAIVNPLDVALATPYHFLNLDLISKYPFTTASIVIKGVGIIISTLLVLSLAGKHHTAKGAILLVAIPLMQLYALQDMVSGASSIPVEWALSISLSGLVLVVPMIWYFIRGAFSSIAKEPISIEEAFSTQSKPDTSS